MNKPKGKNLVTGRREFISMITAAAALGCTGLRGAHAFPAPGNSKMPGVQQTGMPVINLGKHKISRLICGSNPLLGYSYLGSHTDRHMKEYFTTEQTVEFLLNCEKAGILTHQCSSRFDYLKPLRDRGSKLNFICLHQDREKLKEMIANSDPIAMVHHGGATDRFFAAGQFSVVQDYVKAVKDTGLLAGISAHNPDVIKRIADEGWEVDFFMTCFYYLTRKMDTPELTAALPVGSYTFFKDDPARMTQVIRQVSKPCLAFKILGAGRQCSDQKKVRAAFHYAFENIKPVDAVIVGMFPWYFDEISANSQYVRETGNLTGN